MDIDFSGIFVLVDHIGRRFVGLAKSDTTKPTIVLRNPIVMSEIVSQREGRVGLNFGPVLHLYEVDEIEVKWITKFKANKKLSSDYYKFMQEIEAKRNSNLAVVSHLPANLPQVGV